MAYPEKANVSLKFVVVGGGIAGLATAYALAKAGHEVTVLEKSDGNGRVSIIYLSPVSPGRRRGSGKLTMLGKAGGGIRCPPNMTRVFDQWGLRQALNEIAVHCQRINWYSGDNADYLGCLVVDDFLRDVAANFHLIQHGRLIYLLTELGKQEGVDLRFNSRVLGADPDTGYVFLENGGQIYGDVIIAADGYNSILRPIVVGEEDDPTPEKTVLLTFTVPATVLEGDVELRSLIDLSLWSFWIGEKYMVYGNMLNNGHDYTIFISHQYDGEQYPGDWRSIDDINQFGISFGKLDSRVRKLLQLATSISGRVIFSQLKVDNLVCENSRIALVGDAAHPILHGGNNSQAFGFEDAQTLGSLFSKLQRKDQVSQLLTAYNEIRQPWSSFAVSHTYKLQSSLKVETGPKQEFRDARLRAIMVHLEGDHVDEVLFKEVWGNDLALFLHDAREKVDDWWSQWGSSIVKSPNRQSLVPPVRIEVSTTNTSETKET